MRLPSYLALTLSILAIAIAGCGGGDGGSSGSALESGLSFLPKDAPFVVAIDTDVEGGQYENLSTLVNKLPLGGQIEKQLKQQIESSGGDVSYDEDIKPLLGNPFVIGVVDARFFTADGDTDDFVGAIQAKDGDELVDVLKRSSGAKESGEQSGATIYENDGDRFAIKDDMLVVAGSDQLLDAALTRADGGDHLDEDDVRLEPERSAERGAAAHVLRRRRPAEGRPRHPGRAEGQVGRGAAHLRADRQRLGPDDRPGLQPRDRGRSQRRGPADRLGHRRAGGHRRGRADQRRPARPRLRSSASPRRPASRSTPPASASTSRPRTSSTSSSASASTTT